jgi:HK97 family phage major capsid protein
VTASASGKVGTTGQTLTVTYDDLVDLVHSIDPLYRGPRARFMLHDSSLKVIQKLKDTQNRPIWVAGLGEPSLAAPNPSTILGYPYTINPDMPVMAANAKSILFGDFSNYLVREVTDFTVLRLVERYAEYLQVAFIGFQRVDGNLINAGTNPIKFYQNSAT